LLSGPGVGDLNGGKERHRNFGQKGAQKKTYVTKQGITTCQKRLLEAVEKNPQKGGGESMRKTVGGEGKNQQDEDSVRQERFNEQKKPPGIRSSRRTKGKKH